MEGVCNSCMNTNDRLCTFDKNGFTPLIRAAKTGHVGCLKKIIQAGADVNRKSNAEAATALMKSAMKVSAGHLECAKMLLKAGADVNEATKNQFGNNDYTALMLAATYNNRDCLKLLLRSGANVNTKDLSGATALSHAAQWSSPEIVSVLVKAGADVNTRQRNGKSPLLIACTPRDEDCVDILIRAGADVNVVDKAGQTPLTSAAMFGIDSILKLLIKAGADVNALGRHGFTALTEAVSRESTQCLKTLLEAGAGVNVKGENGITPLIKAAGKPDVTCLDLILKAGADVNAENWKKETALHVAIYYRRAANIKRLLEAGVNVNVGTLPTLDLDNQADHLEIQRAFLDAGADVNVTDASGFTALMKSAGALNEDCVKLLLDKGADVNMLDYQHRSVLHHALNDLPIDCFRLLLDAGADVNGVNDSGDTPLCFLAWTLSISSGMRANKIRTLLQYGAIINHKDRMGRNALNLVRSDQAYQTKMLLLAAGDGLSSPQQIPSLLLEAKAADSLKTMCREVIRGHIIDLEPHSNLFLRIPKLGLPQIVNEFLLYEMSLDINDDNESQ